MAQGNSTKDGTTLQKLPEADGSGEIINTDDRFYYYSSKAGKTPQPNVHISSPSDVNIDTFLGFLPKKGVILPKRPAENSSQIHESDEWAKWMKNWDTEGILSLSFDNITQLNIQYFSFEVKVPWNLVFKSSEEIISVAFGVDTITGKSRVPKPGMNTQGTPIYFGLDPQQTPTDLKSTVGLLFKTARLDKLLSAVPEQLRAQSVTLKRSDIVKKRNCLWFYPERRLETLMRLRFVFDTTTELQTFLTGALPGLKVDQAAVLLKMSMAQDGAHVIKSSRIQFEVDSYVIADNQTAYLVVGTTFLTTGFYLTVKVSTGKLQTSDPFTVIIAWLISLLPKDSGLESIKELLLKENFFTNHIHLRRLRVDVDMAGQKPQLQRVGIDLEISTASFGQGKDKSKRVPFLVTYSWSRVGGATSSIHGELWNDFNISPNRILNPSYEQSTDLIPLTESPADSINLVSLIAGETIDNVPRNIPTRLTQASIYLSPTMFGIMAMFRAIDSGLPGQNTFPQITFDQMWLEASFAWGKTKNFSLALDTNTILKAGKDDKNQDVAILRGSLHYTSSSGSWKLTASLGNLPGSAA